MRFLLKRNGLIIDIMVIMFVICILHQTNHDITAEFGRNVIICLSCYCLTRLVLQYTRHAGNVLVIILVIVTSVEVTVSTLQLFGIYPSRHLYFPVTGTFFNPGILGGYLSTSTCLLFAYSVHGGQKWLATICRFVAIAAAGVLPSTHSRAAILSLMTCVLLSAVCHKKSLLVIRKYCYVIIPCLALVLLSFYLMKQRSADGRMLISRISCNVIKHDGIFVGVDSFAGVYGEEQAHFFRKMMSDDAGNDLEWDRIPSRIRMSAECTNIAFNEYLQICSDYGLGVLALFLTLSSLSIAISCHNGTIWYYGMVAFLVFAFFSYPLHILEMQIMFSVMLASCIQPNQQNISSDCLILLLPVIIIFIHENHYFPEYKEFKKGLSTLKYIEYWHMAEYYDNVVDDCSKNTDMLDDNSQFLFAYGHSLNKIGQYEKSDSILRLGTEISSDPMFWNVMGNNSLALGRYREAEERYKHAFYMVPNRLYPLTLLAKLYHAEGDTARFLDMADKVETFVPKIENANTARLRAEIREIREGYNIEAIKKDEEQ